MKTFSVLLLIGAFLPSVTVSAATATPPPTLPVESFFQKSAIASIRFSPDGKSIACLVAYQHRMNLAVIDLEKKTKNLLTNFTDNDVGSYVWCGNDRLVFTKDEDGNEAPGAYAVDRDGRNPLTLSEPGHERFRLVDTLQDDPKHVLVEYRMSGTQGNDLGLMNIRTGAISMYLPNPGFIREWILDRNHKARAGVSVQRGSTSVLYRGANGGDWEILVKDQDRDSDNPTESARGWLPLAFDGDNRTLYVAGRLGGDRMAVYRYDTDTLTLGGKVCEDPVYDVATEADDYSPYPLNGVIYDEARKKVVGFAYRAEKPRVNWFDDEFRSLQRIVDQALPGTCNFILKASPDDSKQLVFAMSDRDPGVYYLLDRKTRRIEELAVLKPGIDPDQMAPMQPIEFPARDGLVLHGYLTLPLGRPAKGLPLVIHPHGGPYGIRDDWVFTPEVQFYANRGFAVLQVNYRGSGGYGRSFQHEGYRKWGLEMQNDLTDAVAWAVSRGVADPKRVVISGASYGGYAAMAGLTFTPELYCAGINYVGVTNLSSQWGKYHGTSDDLRLVRRRFADMENTADRRRAYDTSPCNFADKIRAPLLMAYGKNDPRVNVDQGYDMEAALKRAGKRFEFVLERDEGHGFRKEERSIAFFTRVDEFLQANVLAHSGADVRVGDPKVIDMPAKEPVKN